MFSEGALKAPPDLVGIIWRLLEDHSLLANLVILVALYGGKLIFIVVSWLLYIVLEPSRKIDKAWHAMPLVMARCATALPYVSGSSSSMSSRPTCSLLPTETRSYLIIRS